MKRVILAALMAFMMCSACYAAGLFHPDKTGDETLNALIADTLPKFTVKTFSDDVTGLTLDYNIYFPENYSREKNYPVVFFIADGSSSGKPPEFSLRQGYGGLVWTAYECVVIVPAYPVTVLDDHNGFVKSDYVELTGRFVRWAVKSYGLDERRVYATGQSMGCMTFLVLAAEYPGMFTACLFVSGQWDINELSGLAGQKFVYVASLGDEKASTGQREVIGMFDAQNTPYVSYMNIDAKNPGTITPAQRANFVTFREGTTLPDGTDEKYSEHMTSFDYAYRIEALRVWLLSQVKE